MHSGRLDLQVVAAPAAFAAALPPAGAARGVRGADWMTELAADQRRFATPLPETGPGVDLGAVCAVLERRLPDERVVTYGSGNATLWGQRYLSHNVPHSLVGPRNGAMGLAVPAAVAASLAFPARQAVAICGDGDFMMNPQELSAAFAHGSAPLVIVADNGIYGTIAQHQRAQYPGRPSGTAATNPDFAAGIRSFGGHGEYVERTGDFGDALERALASGLPALIHLRTDPGTMPPPADNAPDTHNAERTAR
ncbi:MAG: thiamine pyrophosphate-dependent enzyme [Arthrobacter sp.]|uniref:thiamine pyrophosphate-dependent enzyme n=1 Tax=Arthrobacter sp. TaxID=1667 RepID=UPI0034859FD9